MGFFSSSSKPIYHFHFQKLITDSPDSLAFVSLEEFVKFIDPFLSKREKRELLPSETKSFFVPRPSTGGRGKGGEAKVWGKGKGKNTRPATSNFFPTRCTRKTRKIVARVAVPPSAPLPYSREDSIVEIRIESRFHDSAMISTIDGRF